jgi:tetratricopeptide (TPR) repeat protein
MKVIITVSIIGFFSFPALAQEKAIGWNEFKEGNFNAAVTASASDDSADSLTLNCRSNLVIGGFQTKGDEAISALHNALTSCQKAIEKDPDHVIARMSYAMALGFEGKRLNSPSLATKSRKQIEKILEKNPDHVLANGALGGWHSEVAAAGFLARIALGAKRGKAKTQFNKAIKAGSLDIPLKFEYIRYLARGNKTERAQAIQEIDALLELKPGFAFEEMVQERAKRLRSVVEAGKSKAIKKMLNELSPFFGITKWGKKQPAYKFDKKAD